jgi:hypothetical protein
VGAGGRDLVRVDERHPCPVCSRATLCRVDVLAMRVWCCRVVDGALYSLPPEKGLRPAWVHALDGSNAPRFERAAPTEGDVERADPEQLDAMHRFLLALLVLLPVDTEELRRRGLPDEHIARGLYRSMPEQGRAALARKVVERFGEEAARGLPGIARRTDPADPSRAWLSLAGWPGLLVPVVDLNARVVALKVRRRGTIAADQPRYTYVSSGRAGPRALASVHVPPAALALRPAPLVITEGELKADVSTALCGRPVASVPGVGNWRRGVELARVWGAASVTVAFDADARTNPDVARHLRDFVSALAAEGLTPRLWTWQPPATDPGLDAFLLARRDARFTAPGSTHR